MIASVPPPPWQPRYTLTPTIVRSLLEIEAARTAIEHTPLPPAAQEELRRQARLRSTHYSTRIEGNRLTLAEAEVAVVDPRVRFQGRERDVLEVRNYWHALLRVEDWAGRQAPLTVELIQRLHALVERGPRARPTPFRDGQNVIRDGATGAIVYLPPESKGVPSLMTGLVAWVQKAEREGLPVPVIAGLAHYQFVTIHPYYDGNGRTGRLLATFLLHRGGYGLNGFFSLEEHHARDLAAYYHSLASHPHHNYYEGRETADLTPWLAYFTEILARVFQAAREESRHAAQQNQAPGPDLLYRLEPRARVVLGLLARQEQVTNRDVSRALALSDRMARVLLQSWVEAGWLEIAEPSRRARAYRLSAIYRQFIGNPSATTG